jgi:hypothetical protein
VRDLEVEIENMGGSLNAYTGREQTCYYAKVRVRVLGTRACMRAADSPAACGRTSRGRGCLPQCRGTRRARHTPPPPGHSLHATKAGH